jgi:transcriptional regulator with XRE-family HTH domain
MHPIEFIRKHVFSLHQTAFAQIAGTTQATVSRWENGEFEPSREELEKIRSEARRRNLPWDDRWFFEVPQRSPQPP